MQGANGVAGPAGVPGDAAEAGDPGPQGPPGQRGEPVRNTYTCDAYADIQILVHQFCCLSLTLHTDISCFP